jgi:hypothetical protein
MISVSSAEASADGGSVIETCAIETCAIETCAIDTSAHDVSARDVTARFVFMTPLCRSGLTVTPSWIIPSWMTPHKGSPHRGRNAERQGRPVGVSSGIGSPGPGRSMISMASSLEHQRQRTSSTSSSRTSVSSTVGSPARSRCQNSLVRLRRTTSNRVRFPQCAQRQRCSVSGIKAATRANLPDCAPLRHSRSDPTRTFAASSSGVARRTCQTPPLTSLR